MTMQQPQLSGGPHPWLRAAMKADRACTIAIQALCRVTFDWRVQGVTGAAARLGQAHIAVRYGRLLIYLENRAALEALVDAAEAAYELLGGSFRPGRRAVLRPGGGDRVEGTDNNRPEAATG
jgi:hypothetical protein